MNYKKETSADVYRQGNSLSPRIKRITSKNRVSADYKRR